MLSALNISDIENYVREEYQGTKKSSICIIFSPYNRRDTNQHRNEFLRQIENFHHRSGKHLDCFCVGYSAYEPKPMAGHTDAIKIIQAKPLSYYYPQIFDEFRQHIKNKISKKWDYMGGVEIMLLPVLHDNETPEIIWEKPVHISTNKLIPKPFSSVEALLLHIFSLVEESESSIHPDKIGKSIAINKIVSLVTAGLIKATPATARNAIKILT